MAETRSTPRDTGVIEDRIGDIEDRLQQLLDGRGAQSLEADAQTAGNCALPQVPTRPRAAGISDLRERLVAYTQKKWVNGTNLKYYFFTQAGMRGHHSNAKMVREAFDVWSDLGIGLNFEETKHIGEAELRIAFMSGQGAWSYVGTDNLSAPGQSEPTMNFGWDLRHDPRGIDTALHEIGHALGFPHEHQNPFAGIVWNKEEVIREFSGPPNNWTLAQIEHNILRKLNRGEVSGSAWDPNSVMHYAFGPGLIEQPLEYRAGLTPQAGLSPVDKSEALRFYPALPNGDLRRLAPMVSDALDLAPTEQVSYLLEPDETRTYTIRSLGQADILLVLFREEDDRTIYVDGSDDGGLNENALITARLERGQRYILRVRLMSHYGAGASTVIYW
ncbi:matrixin family metalloprotease [uncultured Tateyamaria sp.]|uniref:matrixin family metalloprotease n=1 Tax=uncultured Tateyamaria sp. TaxID=455651 RepID=UPI0026206818|nr:matrixin family metalloprotease [uncultured Tateyamaria sp.]